MATTSTETAANLILLIRDLGEFRAPQISDAMLLRWLNLSIARFYEAMVDRDESRYTSTMDIAITSGTGSYTIGYQSGEQLIQDFFRLVGCDVLDADSQSGYTTLDRADFRDRNVWSFTSKQGARFEIRNGTLQIYPTPTWSGTVRLHYVPTCPRFATTSSTFDFVDYAQDLVVFDVAVKCAIRLELDTADLVRERDRLDAMLHGKTMRIDHTGPKTVRDAYALGGRRGDFAEDVSG